MSKSISLKDYVRQKLGEKSLTHRQVKSNSQGQVSPTYVNDILQDKISSPTVEKLQSLARGLEVSEEEIFRVARGLPISLEDNSTEKERLLIYFFRRLSVDLQEIVYAVTEMFYRRFTARSTDQAIDAPDPRRQIMEGFNLVDEGKPEPGELISETPIREPERPAKAKQ